MKVQFERQVRPDHKIEIGWSSWDHEDRSCRNRIDYNGGMFSNTRSSEVATYDLPGMVTFCAEHREFDHEQCIGMIKALAAPARLLGTAQFEKSVDVPTRPDSGKGAAMKYTIECIGFRPLAKNTLVGFAKIRIDELKLVINGVTLSPTGRRALGRPPREAVEDRDGTARRDNRG